MRIVLHIIQGFMAVNALAGGYLLMRAPDCSLLQLPQDFMQSRLFADLFWPGSIRFVVLVLGHGVGFLLTLRRHRNAPRVAFILGSATLIRIAVQVLMTELFRLQGLIAGMGLMEALVGWRMR